MKLHLRLVVAVTAVLFVGLSSLHAQESLRDIVQESGTGWMLGKWTGTNSEGVPITVEYEWELDGYAVEIDLEMERASYKGLIFRRPTDGQVVEVGADNSGGMTRSIWREDQGLLISERIGARPDGQVMRIAVVSKQLDDNTMEATVRPLSEEGAIGEESLDTVNLTRVTEDEDDDD